MYRKTQGGQASHKVDKGRGNPKDPAAQDRSLWRSLGRPMSSSGPLSAGSIIHIVAMPIMGQHLAEVNSKLDIIMFDLESLDNISGRMFKFIQTDHGKRYAMLNHFTYFKHYMLKFGNRRWQCTKHTSQSCGAYLIMDAQGNVVKKNDIHTHHPTMYGCTSDVLLVKGRNGKDLLMLNGYTYYQHKILRDGFRWSCTQMGSRSCRGFLHVTNEMMVVRAFTEHTHPPSTYLLKSTKKQMKLKPTAVNDAKRHSEREALNPLAFKIANIHGRSNF